MFKVDFTTLLERFSYRGRTNAYHLSKWSRLVEFEIRQWHTRGQMFPAGEQNERKL